MFEPCYFYVDYTGAKTYKHGRVWPLCLECAKTQKDKWYWNKGYGPFEIKCHKCEKLIYEVSNSSSDTRQSKTNG